MRYLMEKFPENRPGRFEENLCKKTVRKKKKIIIIWKKKPNKNNKVFRWKRKTLTRIRAIASNSQVTRRFPFATPFVLIRGVLI